MHFCVGCRLKMAGWIFVISEADERGLGVGGNERANVS